MMGGCCGKWGSSRRRERHQTELDAVCLIQPQQFHGHLPDKTARDSNPARSSGSTSYIPAGGGGYENLEVVLTRKSANSDTLADANSAALPQDLQNARVPSTTECTQPRSHLPSLDEPAAKSPAAKAPTTRSPATSVSSTQIHSPN